MPHSDQDGHVSKGGMVMKSLAALTLVCLGLMLPLRLTAISSSGSVVLAAQFDSELAAVLDAVTIYNPVSIRNDVEYLGAVYKQSLGGQVRYGYTVGMGEPGKDSVTVSVSLPVDSTLLAFWHTHGAGHWTRNYFSDVDTQLANDWGVPFYLATPQGDLRVYKPGDPVMGRLQARRLGLGNQSGYASGRVVSAV